ncbi:MAG TPA: VWA domain-containing protein [Propionibacteriaceae bacterium]|nr:VWA domain-containing protein [Propionibacteriaceae bacterium]
MSPLVPLVSLPQFASPGRLWVLLVPPLLLLAYILAIRMKGRSSVRFTNTAILGAVMPKQTQWRRHVAVAMSLASLVALTMAWARPLGVEKVPRERATVVVVIDISRSMGAVDVKPNRLDVAKQAAESFIDQLPSQYNVAVVALSGKPQIVMPPSIDRDAIHRAISHLELADGTAIGDAIHSSLKAIKEAPLGPNKSAAPAMVVMLSDGTNTAGSDPLAAAASAKQAKVPIYTIAYGTENGYVDLDSQRYRVPPDPALLTQISQETGGREVSAKSAGQLDSAYKDLKSSVGYEKVRKEVTAEYAMYALGFAVVAALGAVSMAGRWP